jgi:hypothetical protein
MQATYPSENVFVAKEFPDEDAAKVAAKLELARGATTAVAGRLPKKGDRFTLNGFIYEVKEIRTRGRLFLKLLGTN